MTAINANINVTANVATVDVIPPSTTNLFAPTLTTQGPWVEAKWTISYRWDYHIYQLPTASDQVTTASFAVAANPTLKRIVRFVVDRSITMPVIPSPMSTDTNEVLLSAEITTKNMDVEADGNSQNWRINGEYVYGVIDPTKVKIYAGAAPYLTTQFAQTEIPVSQFVTGLTCPPGAYSPNLTIEMN